MAQEVSFNLGSVQPNRTTEARWPPAWEDPNMSYGAPFAMMFLPTWSTWWEESNLPTYHGRNKPQEAGDEEAARTVLNGGGDGTGSGGVGRGSSSKRWINVVVSSAAARWQRHGSAMAARVRAKFAWDRALFIGFFAPNCRRPNS
jgi:hypothetical protein